jgi:O-acetyl-ADP-ribose deacetylase (regulator of RNase III)
MNRSLCHTDITTCAADALIYSTNVQLMLSGGVGACLLARYGKRFQDDLYALLDASGRRLASVGEVFVTSTTGLPWKKVYHVVATDPFYNTAPMVVRRILTQCLAECSTDSDISSVVMSPLGAGYGDLEFPQFLEIVSELSEADLDLAEVSVCCDDEDFFKELVNHRKNVGVLWTVRETFLQYPSP